MTVVALNALNSVVPVYTDSLVLIHLIKEKASRSNSKVNLVSTMGTPVLLKCARLASAVMSIHASTEFIITSLTVGKGGNAPNNIDIVETARKWGVYVSSGLQLVDNLSVFYTRIWRCPFFSLTSFALQVLARRALDACHSDAEAHHRLVMSVRASFLHSIPQNFSSSYVSLPAPTVPTSFSGLVLSLGSQYVLPIVLNAVQLAVSSYIPSGNAAMLIDSAKVVINITSASVTTLRKNLAEPQGPSTLLKKVEDVSRDVLKIPVPLVPIPDAGGATAPAYMPTSTVAPAGEDLKDSVSDPEVSTVVPQLNPGHHFSSSPGSS